MIPNVQKLKLITRITCEGVLTTRNSWSRQAEGNLITIYMYFNYGHFTARLYSFMGQKWCSTEVYIENTRYEALGQTISWSPWTHHKLIYISSTRLIIEIWLSHNKFSINLHLKGFIDLRISKGSILEPLNNQTSTPSTQHKAEQHPNNFKIHPYSLIARLAQQSDLLIVSPFNQ